MQRKLRPHVSSLVSGLQGRLVVISLVSLLLMGPLAVSVSAQSTNQPDGFLVRDITAEADCWITLETLAGEPGTAVVDTTTAPCPAGSAVVTTPATKAEANELGTLYIRATGDAQRDQAAIERAKANFNPAEAVLPTSQVGVQACQQRSYQRTMQYYAYSPGVNVYSKVYYSQTYECDAYIGTVLDWLSWEANLYWRFSNYQYTVPGHGPTRLHDCDNLSPSGTSDTYTDWKIYTGGLFGDEVETHSACYGWGTSYNNEMYL